MEIIRKIVSVVRFNLDVHYFEKYSEVHPAHGHKFVWTSAAEGSLLYTYMHSFALSADDAETDFLQCLQHMELHCKIDDVETDADALIPVKKELELEMKAFLEANCWTHSEHLHFTLAEQEIYDNHRGHDIRGIESAMMFPFKTKTEVQKEVEKKMMRSIPFFDRHKSSTPRPPRLKPGETRTTTIILNPPLPPSFPSLE